MIRIIYLLIITYLFFFTSCSQEKPPSEKSLNIKQLNDEIKRSIGNNKYDKLKYINDTTIIFKRNGEDVMVHFFNSKNYDGKKSGTIILLPGWNYSSMDWCTKTTFCKNAKELGYNLILVDMAKSVYSWKIYEETDKKYKKYATRQWFTDTLIPYFQSNFKLLKKGGNNYILGLSTGGRGAALICLDRPKIFKKGASLSGDFNQASIPRDQLMKGFYGGYHSFKNRWIGNDNVVYNINRFETPFYLGHGGKDKIVPKSQTQEFYDSLRSIKPNLNVIIHIDLKARHDYKYWNSEVNNVLDFFKAL